MRSCLSSCVPLAGSAATGAEVYAGGFGDGLDVGFGAGRRRGSRPGISEPEAVSTRLTLMPLACRSLTARKDASSLARERVAGLARGYFAWRAAGASVISFGLDVERPGDVVDADAHELGDGVGREIVGADGVAVLVARPVVIGEEVAIEQVADEAHLGLRERDDVRAGVVGVAVGGDEGLLRLLDVDALHQQLLDRGSWR